MAKKRTETNVEVESKGAKSAVRKNQSPPNPQAGEGNGGAGRIGYDCHGALRRRCEVFERAVLGTRAARRLRNLSS